MTNSLSGLPSFSFFSFILLSQSLFLAFFFAVGSSACLVDDSVCFAALESVLVDRVANACVPSGDLMGCTNAVTLALKEQAPSNADELYQRLLPSFVEPAFLPGQVMDVRDVLFFRSLLPAFEARDRAARIPLQDVSLGWSQFLAMPRGGNCTGLDWLGRWYKSPDQLDLRFSGCVDSPFMHRTREDLQSRLFFTLKSHARFMQAVMVRCPTCMVVGDWLSQIMNATRASNPQRDRVVPFATTVSVYFHAQSSSFCSVGKCLDNMIDAFVLSYSRLSLNEILNQQFKWILESAPIGESGQSHELSLAIWIIQHRDCLAAWNSTCRKRTFFKSSSVSDILTSVGPIYVLWMNDLMAKNVTSCMIGCSALRESYQLISSFASSRYFATRMLHLLMLYQYCPDAECQAGIKLAYLNETFALQEHLKTVGSLTGSHVDRGVAIIALVFSSVALCATLGVVVFLIIWRALFVSYMYTVLLACNVLETGLLLVFAVLAMLSTGSVEFDRLMPVLVVTLEMISLIVFLRNFLDAVYGEVISTKWKHVSSALSIGMGGLLLVTCGLSAVVCWAVADDARASIVNDLDSLTPGVFYVCLVGFGLVLTCVLLGHAVVGWMKLRLMTEATQFQVRTLLKLVVVSGGLVAAFLLSFVFAMLRISTFAVVAPLWAFMLLGLVVPLCIVLACMTFFILNAVFSDSLRNSNKPRSDLIPLLEATEERPIPKAYEI